MCLYCGRELAVEYIPGVAQSAACQCPHESCRKTLRIGGMAKVLSVAKLVRTHRTKDTTRESLPVFCAYCGQPASVSCQRPACPPGSLYASVWQCPHSGCRRDNAIKDVQVISATTRELPV